MSAAVLLSAVAPSAGPVAAAKVDARSVPDVEVFGAILDQGATVDTPSGSGPKRQAEASAPASAESTLVPEVASSANDAVSSTVPLVSVVPLVPVVAPPGVATVPSLAVNEAGPEADVALSGLALADEGSRDPEVVPAEAGASAEAIFSDRAREIAIDSSAGVNSRLPAGAARPVASATSAAPSGQTVPPVDEVYGEIAGDDRFVSAPGVAPIDAAPIDVAPIDVRPDGLEALPATSAKLISPVAADPAREVANVRSAVIAPLRSSRVVDPVDPVAPATASAPTAEALLVNDEADGESVGDALPVTPPVAAPAGVTRVRDVIDGVLARPSAEGPAPAETQGPRVEGKVSTDAAPAAATTTPAIAEPAAARPPIEVPSAVVLSASAEEAPAAPPVAVTPSSEAGSSETTSAPAASTLSRTAVETTAQIAAQIVRKLGGQSTRFEMALTPEDLGRVDISLDIDADGALHATLAFDNPIAASELRGRADELRRQLLDAGFTLAEDALSFSERDPAGGQGGAFDREPDPRSARAFGAASRLNAEADLSLQAPHWISLNLTPAGVDMKV